MLFQQCAIPAELGAWIPVIVMEFNSAMHPAAYVLSLMFKIQANV